MGFVCWASGLLEMGPASIIFWAADFFALTTFLRSWWFSTCTYGKHWTGSKAPNCVRRYLRNPLFAHAHLVLLDTDSFAQTQAILYLKYLFLKRLVWECFEQTTAMSSRRWTLPPCRPLVRKTSLAGRVWKSLKRDEWIETRKLLQHWFAW